VPASGRTRTLTITLPLPSFCIALSAVAIAFVPVGAGASSSPTSSNVVTLVAYDPCAEEFLLCGGDGKLRWPPFSTASDSPLPFSRLGGESGDFANRLRPPTLDARGVVFLKLVLLAGVTGDLKPGAILDSTDSPFGVELADSGLGG
jgi:hypothetical protein